MMIEDNLNIKNAESVKLSIITVNLNNAVGLELSLKSLFEQTFTDYELIIIDGGSTDGSVEVIKKYEAPLNPPKGGKSENFRLRWVSEKDKGIYNAMNKGIEMAKGEYCYFLNSGELFCNNEVLQTIFQQSPTASFIFGNAVLVYDKVLRVEKFNNMSFSTLYADTICHQASFIKRSMFATHGFYDEQLKIVSDWKFYFECIALNTETVVYMDVNIVFHDMYGVSITQTDLLIEERKRLLESYLPAPLIEDFNEKESLFADVKMIQNYKYAIALFKLLIRIVNKVHRMHQKREIKVQNNLFAKRMHQISKK